MRRILLIGGLCMAAGVATAQHQHDHAAAAASGKESDAGQAMEHSASAMEAHHLHMGAHMKMTPVRALHDGDQARAAEVLEGARHAAEKYRDYRAALNDGFEIFLPNVPQKMYHFTNYQY